MRRNTAFALIAASFSIWVEGCGRPGGELRALNLDYSPSSLSFGMLSQSILRTRCLSCHDGASAAAGIDLSAYDQVMASGTVVPYAPESSRLYLSVRSGSMPKGNQALSDGEIQMIYDWIKLGANRASSVKVASVSPAGGPSGSRITILGVGFLEGSAVVLGGAACTDVTLLSSEQIGCTTGPHADGSVDVVVTVPGSAPATLAGGFSYVSSTRPPPGLASIAPRSGPDSGGTTITLSGSGFSIGASISIAAQPCGGVRWISSSLMTCITRAHASGKADVAIVNPDAQTSRLTAAFTYSLDSTFSSLSRSIFQARCLGCHSGAGAAAGVDLSSHAATLASGTVVPYSPEASSLHFSVSSAGMPIGGAPLSPPEVQAVYDWIAEGALNNWP